ncbi:MAG: hypothetical protein QOF20_2800, partial [Acidimicrobiaceae bacterium]|nr:hypothetical protein [Acidimicrobiaceae bacterium]
IAPRVRRRASGATLGFGCRPRGSADGRRGCRYRGDRRSRGGRRRQRWPVDRYVSRPGELLVPPRGSVFVADDYAPRAMGGGNLRRIGLLAVLAITVLSLGWGSGSLLGRDTPGGLTSTLLSATPVVAPRGPTKVNNSGSLTPRSDLNLALFMLSLLVAASVGRRRPRWLRSVRSNGWPSLVRRRYAITLRAPPAVRHL